MKKVVEYIIESYKRICRECHGMGYIELPNGDTKECFVCKGMGVIDDKKSNTTKKDI